MGEIMEACNKHASTDKTRDDEEDKGKGPANNTGKNNNNSGQNGNNNNNGNQHKCPYEGNSYFVANTNTRFQKPRRDNNFQSNNGNHNDNNTFRGPPRPGEAFRMPCPYHSKMSSAWICRGGKMRRSRNHYTAAIMKEDPD